MDKHIKERLEQQLAKKLGLNWNEKTQSWDCDKEVMLVRIGLHKLPIRFGIINGYLRVYDNFLTDWTIFPTRCDELHIQRNLITSLEGMPDCTMLQIESNKLTSLKGLSSKVTSLWVSNNLLTNLDYCNKTMISVDADSNKITSLKSPIKKIQDLCKIIKLRN